MVVDLKFEFYIALADLIYCVFGLPVIAAELINNRHWNLGLVGCKLVSAIILINLYGSVYFLSTISIGKSEKLTTDLKLLTSGHFVKLISHLKIDVWLCRSR